MIWETSPGVFLFLTCFLGGGAAWLSGRAIALTWRPYYQVVLYVMLLSAATRFLHFALFDGTLLSPYYFLIDLAVLFMLGSLGFRLTRAQQMARQYNWLYERTGLFSWRLRDSLHSQQ